MGDSNQNKSTTAITTAIQSTFLNDRRDELTDRLRSKLIECGWRDQVSNMCREFIHKHGIEHTTLEEILGEVRPKAKQIVPDTVKRELLDIMKQMNGQDSGPTADGSGGGVKPSSSFC